MKAPRRSSYTDATGKRRRVLVSRTPAELERDMGLPRGSIRRDPKAKQRGK